jgi:hypothetical protein
MSSDPAHDLMPADMVAVLPRLYETEGRPDAIVHLKWFTPDANWTWYVVEFDPEERLCFGLVQGHEREHGYFSLDEIEQLRGPLGLRVERDLYWKPCSLSQVP